MVHSAPSVGQIIKRIHSKEIYPVYSLFGNESFLQDFFIKELTKNFLDKSANKILFSLDDDKQDDLLVNLNSISLFNERKLIVVRQIHKLKTNLRKELFDYLVSPNCEICLVLISENFDDKNSLQKNLRKHSLFIDVRVPFPSKMKEWINFIVKIKKYKINDGTISNLIDLYGDSISHVINEIDRLSLMLGHNVEINQKSLKFDLTMNREFAIWQLQDALGCKNFSKSLLITKSLIDNGVSLPQIIINLTNFFHQLLWYSMDRKWQTGYTGLNKIIAKNLKKYFNNFNGEEIENALLSLRKIDMLKKSTSINSFSLIEPIIINICKGIYV